jgi:hypothetical protein
MVAVLVLSGDSVFSSSHPKSAPHLSRHRNGNGYARWRVGFIVPEASDARHLEGHAGWSVGLLSGFHGIRFLGAAAGFPQL